MCLVLLDAICFSKWFYGLQCGFLVGFTVLFLLVLFDDFFGMRVILVLGFDEFLARTCLIVFFDPIGFSNALLWGFTMVL